MASGQGLKVLPSGAGYGIVIGIGGVFAILMLGITWLQNRYVLAVNPATCTVLSDDYRLAFRPNKQRNSIRLLVLLSLG